MEPLELDELQYLHAMATERVLAPAEGRDPCDLAQVGWGVVFPADGDPAVRAALRDLLDHRRQQATARDPAYYREFWGEAGYRPGESKSQFLARHGAAPGPVDPARVPYYLLLVGDGLAIPFAVQYQLDVQYAVGRVSFDTPQEYRRYAVGVVQAETGGAQRRREVAFFAPQNPDDKATERSRRDLVEPLAQRLAAEQTNWQVNTAVADEATKRCLGDLMGGERTPALLVTASHGLGWPVGHPHQSDRQGALVCQEWPGPRAKAPLSDGEYLSAGDVPDEADVHGLIAVLFACYGVGTPEWDMFDHRDEGAGPGRLAGGPLVSALPRRLLAHPRGGALAVAGHVDKAWGYSFTWPGAGRQSEVYRSCLVRLLSGHTIGSAFEYINQRYAELSADLTAALEEVRYGRRPDHLSLATMWTANNEARACIVLGDPAVRLVSSVTVDPVTQHGRPAAGPDLPPDSVSAVPADATVGSPTGADAGPDLVAAVHRLTGAVERLAESVDRLGEEVRAARSTTTPNDGGQGR